MRTKILTAVLLLSLESGGAARAQPETKIPAGISEPTKCYRMMGQSGLKLTVGSVLELCAGSASAEKTVACFIEAYGPTTNNGLGLTLGFALDLCRASPKQSRF